MKRIVPLVLAVLMLWGCGRREATPTGPAQSAAAEGATVPESTTPPTGPPAPPIEAVTLGTADQWNTFARAFNENREAYADTLALTITGALDFSGMPFITLGTGFSGSIAASETGMGFYHIHEVAYPSHTTAMVYQWTDWWEALADKDYADPATLAAYGTQSPASGLFGAWSEGLFIKGITFGDIEAANLAWLLGSSAAKIELVDVHIQDCFLTGGTTFLASNAGAFTARNLSIKDSALYAHTRMDGLLQAVHGDVSISGLRMENVKMILSPDTGGSGMGLGMVSMTVKLIGGTARYEDLYFYGCTAAGVRTYVLGSSSHGVTRCAGVEILNCALLAMAGSSMYSPHVTDILYGHYEQETPPPIPGEDVRITDSIVAPGYSLDYYRSLGWDIRGCSVLYPEGYVPNF